MSKTMRLAFCLFKYFPFGGLQRDFLRIAKECLQRKHMVDVYTMQWEGAYEPGLGIRLIQTTGLQNHTRREDFVEKIKPDLKQGQYDLIVGFNKMPGLDVYYAADTCYQAKARNQHSWLYRFTSRYRHSVAYEHAVFAAQAKTEILLISEMQQAEFMHYYHTPTQRFHLLPPGIAKDRIAPANASQIRALMRDELEIKNDEFMLLMVGSGFKTKGLDRIVLAIAALPDALKSRARVVVVGKDHARPFQRLAKQWGVSDHFIFLGGQNAVPAFLLAADLLLHPAYNENTGTVLLEALASGLPVLTTDVCGYGHYIESAKAGIVLPSPFQQDQMNKTLVRMLSDERHQWQQNALDFSKNADIYSMPEHAVNFIESLG